MDVLLGLHEEKYIHFFYKSAKFFCTRTKNFQIFDVLDCMVGYEWLEGVEQKKKRKIKMILWREKYFRGEFGSHRCVTKTW